MSEHGVALTSPDARCAKANDGRQIAQLASYNHQLVAVEDGIITVGLRSAVWETFNEAGTTPRILRMGLPDRYVTHGKPALLHEEVGFTAQRVVERVKAALAGREQDAPQPSEALPRLAL